MGFFRHIETFSRKVFASSIWQLQVRQSLCRRLKGLSFEFIMFSMFLSFQIRKKAGWKEFGQKWIFKVLIGLGYAVFNVSFHQRFRMANWILVLRNWTLQQKWTLKGTKEGTFKHSLSTLYSNFPKKFFSLILLFSSDIINWAILVEKYKRFLLQTWT